MTDVLVHDPRVKQQIKEAIYQYIYGPIMLQFDKRLDDIIRKNTLICRGDSAFSYKGEVHTAPLTVPPRKPNKLDGSLITEMDDYLKDRWNLNNYELPFVLSFINQVLNASNHLQDYLRVFPPAIHHPIEELVLACPCREPKLTKESILILQNKNAIPINLLKQRMVTNLIT